MQLVEEMRWERRQSIELKDSTPQTEATSRRLRGPPWKLSSRSACSCIVLAGLHSFVVLLTQESATPNQTFVVA